MTLTIEKEDWAELIQTVKDVREKSTAWVGSGGSSEQIAESQQLLQSFHITAAMLGLQELEEAGLHLEKYLLESIKHGSNGCSVSSFNAALDTLLEHLKTIPEANNNGSSFLEEVSATLNESRGIEETPIQIHEGTSEQSGHLGTQQQDLKEGTTLEEVRDLPLDDLQGLESVVSKLGGKVVFSPESLHQGEEGSFQLHFPGNPSILKRLGTLLAPCDPDAQFASHLVHHDVMIERILQRIKEFMNALSSGNLSDAQEILLTFQEKQSDAGLFVEIGTLARDLHNSLKGFMNTMDPALKDLVTDKLPDSGNRLEHILHLTENAATTTLDHVESLQKRNQMDQAKLEELQQLFSGLKAIGDSAQNRLLESRELLHELNASAAQTRDDLVTILTAQDYQDLTGQIILKIINLLNDLQLKMVNLIRTFGVSIEDLKKAQANELYGPAHQGKLDALHSQDDVDDLLAEFGF